VQLNTTALQQPISRSYLLYCDNSKHDKNWCSRTKRYAHFT